MLELAAILVLGIFAQWFAWKVKLPAILPLIIIGLALGPVSTFFTANGKKLISGDEIFQGEMLYAFVSISVGVILFEGGLTLKLKEIKKLARTVRNLLTIGVLVTLAGGTFAAHFLLGMNYNFAFLFGSLIIVSGPTVITPILRNVKPNQNINAILKWEGILIDPLGALIAVLAYEFIRSSIPQSEYTLIALKEFVLTIATGAFMGALAALLLYYIIQKNRIPEYLRNVVSLGLVILVFAVSDFFKHESGLLAVTVMGTILANMDIEELKDIISFKEDISIILISILFLLLSTQIEVEQINKLGIESLGLFLVVILLIRPLGVLLSTLNANLNWREKLFISWIGPKGIVAAAVASLFTIQIQSGDVKLSEEEMESATKILPLVFMIIVGTVIFQGSSARWVAKLLNVRRESPRGILFVGANEAARHLGNYLKQINIPVIFAESSYDNIREARRSGLPTYKCNVLKENIWEEVDITATGRLLALTPDSEINMLACKKLSKEFGEDNVYRLVSKRESSMKDIEKPKNLLFDGQTDLFSLINIIRKNPEVSVKTNENEGDKDFSEWMEKNKKKIIPLFIKTPEDTIRVVTNNDYKVNKGETLVYILNKAEYNALTDENGHNRPETSQNT